MLLHVSLSCHCSVSWVFLFTVAIEPAATARYISRWCLLLFVATDHACYCYQLVRSLDIGRCWNVCRLGGLHSGRRCAGSRARWVSHRCPGSANAASIFRCSGGVCEPLVGHGHCSPGTSEERQARFQQRLIGQGHSALGAFLSHLDCLATGRAVPLHAASKMRTISTMLPFDDDVCCLARHTESVPSSKHMLR